MTTSFSGEGIKEQQIDNYSQFASILPSFVCPICLDVVKNPNQCETCDSLYCLECFEFLKTGGGGCVMKCKNAKFKKADRFVLDTLSKLKITCETCKKKNIDYNLYITHFEACVHISNLLNNDIESLINEKQLKVFELTADNEKLKSTGSLMFTENIANLSTEDIRKKLLSFDLPATNKVQLYESTVNGNITLFKELILKKKFPIFEEVSAQGYLWTSLHYAMHYGQEEIILFILDYLKTQLNCLELGLRLTAKDGRCPFLCLLKSNSINNDKKKDILVKVLNKYKPVYVSEQVKVELRVRKMEEFFFKYNK